MEIVVHRLPVLCLLVFMLLCAVTAEQREGVAMSYITARFGTTAVGIYDGKKLIRQLYCPVISVSINKLL